MFGLTGRKDKKLRTSAKTPITDVRYVVVDTELTGLDEKKDSIISIGAVRMTGGRIGELVKELSLNVKRSVLIVNRVQDGTDGTLRQAIERTGVEFAGFVPADDLIFEYDLNGKPLVQLPADSKALTSYFAILDRLFA